MPQTVVDLPPIPGEKTQAWDHQRRAYWFARELWESQRPGAYLALGMGCGKTKVAIDLICSLPLHRRVLVFCPKSVVAVWPRQFALHAGKPVFVLPLGEGRLSERAAEAQAFISTPGTEPRVVVANYEAIGTETACEFADWALKVKWDLLVMDEIHRIKSPSGIRSRYLSRLSDRIPRRIGLSGTPLPHSPLDAYGQYRALDKAVLGKSFTAFRARYAVVNPIFPGKVEKFIHQEELSRRMGSIMIQVRSEDALDLPEAVHSEVAVVLTPRTRAVYKRMEDDFVTWAESGGPEVTAANALARLLRLQQIAAGVLQDGESVTRVGSEKVAALEDLLEDLPADEPVVVFARFRADLDGIQEACRRLGLEHAELSGRMNQLDLWQRGGARVLAAQIQSGKEGIDLTRARRAVYYSLGFSLGDYEQSLARIRRPGQQAGTVFYHHLVARNTVDEKVYEALKEKRQVVEAVLDEAKAHGWAERKELPNGN